MTDPATVQPLARINAKAETQAKAEQANASAALATYHSVNEMVQAGHRRKIFRKYQIEDEEQHEAEEDTEENY